MKYCENHVFVWKLSHFYVFSCCLPRSRTKDHRARSLFLELQAVYFKFGTGIFTIIDRTKNAIFREYFSSLCFDSRKIFMIIIFSRGLRATYCIRSKSSPAFKSGEGGQKFNFLKLRSRRLL